MGGYDLMWNDGPVYREDVSLETFGGSSCTANTHLGNLGNWEVEEFWRGHWIFVFRCTFSIFLFFLA